MHKKLLLASMITLALTACDDDVHNSDSVGNSAPTINSDSKLTVSAGQDFTFQVEAQDDQVLTFQLEGNPGWISIDATTGLISVDANQSELGDYTFTVLVSDGELQTRQLITLTVTDQLPDFDNQAPVLTEMPTLTARTYYPLNYRIKASDPNGDHLTYRLSNNPRWVSVNAETGVLTAIADESDVGEHSFIVSVHDGKKETQAEVNLIVELADKPVVNPSNSIPVVLDIPTIQAKSDHTATYRITANDADGDILTFSLQEEQSWVSVNPETGLISISPSVKHVGSHTFNVVITDGHIDVVKSFSVQVALAMTPVDPDNVQVAPFVYDIPVLTAKSNGELAYRVKASDQNNDVLSFDLADAPAWVSINPLSGLIKVKPLDGHVGEYAFSVLVTDGVFTISKPVNLKVELAEIEDNRTAPVVEAVPALNVKANAMLSQRVIASDADNDVLSYRILEQVSWVSIDPNVGLIVAKPQPSHVGSHTFTLSVSDGVFDSVQSFTIVVAEADAPTIPNNLPQIETIEDQTATEGVLSSYRVKASDRDGDVLTYSLSRSRSWMAIDSRTGLITFNPAVGQKGTYRVTTQVSDGEDSVEHAFVVEVLEAPVANVPPVIRPITDIESIAGQETTYRVFATDADGHTLTYSIENGPEWVSIDEIGLVSIMPPPDEMGEFEFTIIVSDGFSKAKQTVTTVVNQMIEPDGPDIIPVIYNSTLMASGKRIIGEVSCNGTLLAGGKFQISEEDTLICHLGHLKLGIFEPRPYADISENRPTEADMAFELTSIHGANVTRVLQAVNECESGDEICLATLSAYDIEAVFGQLDNDEVVDAFLASLAETSTDDIGKAPSSHDDETVVPAISGGSNDLNSGFVSSNAEDTLQYKPAPESQVLTVGVLMEQNKKPLAGIEFYTPSAQGITNQYGEFEFLWGEQISFGLDTYEFGEVKGNKLEFKLADVTDNKVMKDNIQALIERYATNHSTHYEFESLVRETFAEYPNVINEAINLNLPNGGKLEGTDFTLPSEFNAQFNEGITAEIDAILKQSHFSFMDSINMYSSAGETAYVTNSLNEIFKDVKTFHVFHDGVGTLNSVGPARAMRTLNMSNRAFPIMMPRTDKNWRIPFGEKQIFDRDGRPYVSFDPDIQMQPVPVVSSDSATYRFPFVTTGEIGKGKVVFMGNTYYPLILSCPDFYWANSKSETAMDSVNKQCLSKANSTDARSDKGDMTRFFNNLFDWFGLEERSKIATNIGTAYQFVAQHKTGAPYEFFIHDAFGFDELVKISKGGFDSLSVEETPVLLLQGYVPTVVTQSLAFARVADLSQPMLTVDDVTAIIKYINDGGHVIFMDAILGNNPEPIGRLADSAGVMLSTHNEANHHQRNCGNSYYCNSPRPNPHEQWYYDIVVLETVNYVSEDIPAYTVNENGTVTWSPDAPALTIPTYQMSGKTKYAMINVGNEVQKQAAIAELQAAFPSMPVCQDDTYDYEFNCIEFRKGNRIFERRPYARNDFDRYHVDVSSMVIAANLGDNVTKLANHEIYYRSKGKAGTRLSSTDLYQTYDNLSVWLTNDNQYRYEDDIQDELGFKTVVEYLNCYTDNKHQGGAECPELLRETLVQYGMIHGEGELAGQMNPSYPLNYMEKPLTRIMLGRSFWDYDITVDTTAYPTRVTEAGTTQTVDIVTGGRRVHMSAGNMQSTGLWAKQLESVTVSGGVRATVTVMLADDLTGRSKHEKGLKRPPRMKKSFVYDGSELSFEVPYGGLIYIQPKETVEGNVATFSFTNVVPAPFYKDGAWVTSPEQSSVGIAEVDTGHLIYTTPANNVTAQDMEKFVDGMNRFANAASDFYGRDEIEASGKHRRFTYDDLPGFRHRFVNDVQISIGAAHSGYPVMSSTYKPSSTIIPTDAVNNWLLWHEVGHNIASAPFKVTGGTEVTNNLLGLYMQELEGRNANPEMDRIRSDIRKMSSWLPANYGHAWSEGNAGLRLVMFGQLKIWAETHFNVDKWYATGEEKPSIYDADQGWNMFKLMHRKARGDVIGDNGMNYCNSGETGLSDGDNLMVCASYVSGYDLSEFFTTWNPGETSVTNPLGEVEYSGGITKSGLNILSGLDLPVPELKPTSISSLPN